MDISSDAARVSHFLSEGVKIRCWCDSVLPQAATPLVTLSENSVSCVFVRFCFLAIGSIVFQPRRRSSHPFLTRAGGQMFL